MRIIIILKKKIYNLALIIFILGCNAHKIPSKKIYQYNYFRNVTYKSDTLKVKLGNPLKCPLRVSLSSKDSIVNEKIKVINPILLLPESDTVIVFKINYPKNQIQFSSMLGDPDKKITQKKVELPFTIGKKYKIIQGHNGKTSHYTSYSRYAVDFDLKQKDTVCSATNGFVVGVVKDYKYGGWSKNWLPFSNFITIYNPSTGLFTQYVHLYHNGSFVKIGDKVEANQPIGLAGKTGMTNVDHLHFNALVPVNNSSGLKSIPVEFEKRK